jgi:putative intracellular protease/amidase
MKTLKIVIYLYNGVTMLDAIGPYEILRNLPDAEVLFVAEKPGEIKADSGMVFVNVKHGIQDIKHADILLIPGSTIGFLAEMKNKNVLGWIEEVNEKTKWTVSVCTGSLILASAGLLSGKKATSHWKSINLLGEYEAVPTRERIVEQGKYITSAGVSAGIDMALFLSNKIAGEDMAKAIQLIVEYDPKPMFDSGNYFNANEETKKIAEKKMSEEAKREQGVMGLMKHSKNLFKLKK